MRSAIIVLVLVLVATVALAQNSPYQNTFGTGGTPGGPRLADFPQVEIDDVNIHFECFDVSPLPNNTTKLVAHGLTFTRLIEIWGSYINSGWHHTFDATATQSSMPGTVSIRVDATNIEVLTTKNLSSVVVADVCLLVVQ